MKIPNVKLMQLLVGHWELLYTLGQAAEKLADQTTDTMVERWAVLRDVGDQIAPVLDEAFGSGSALNAKLTTGVSTMSIMQSESELEASLVEGVQHTLCEMQAKMAVASMVCASDADEKTIEKFNAAKQSEYSMAFAAATERASRFDGHMLRAGLKLFNELAPLLTTLGPLLLSLLTGGK